MPKYSIILWIMDIRENLTKNEKISTIVLAIVFFSNQVIGSYRLDLLKFSLPMLGIGLGYCVYLTVRQYKSTLQCLISPCIIWILIMNVMLYIYGAIWKVVPEVYARSYHFLNLAHLLVLVMIMYHEQKSLRKILPLTASLMIIAESIFVIIYNRASILMNLTGGDVWGDYTRIGRTPCAGVIETCITMAICTVPVIVEIIAKRRMIFLVPLAFSMLTIGASMQKSGIVAVLITVLVVAIGVADEKKTRIRNCLIIVAACAVMLLVSYFVPFLRVNVYERFNDMFYTLINLDTSDAHSSTSKRLMYIFLALKTSWNKPVFGHGLYAFGHQIAGFDRTETVYPDSHSNFTELLYSCGLVGMAVYYWFPIKNLIDAIRMKHSFIKLAVVSLILNMFFYDTCNISFYRNIIGYVAFAAAYLLIKNAKEAEA